MIFLVFLCHLILSFSFVDEFYEPLSFDELVARSKDDDALKKEFEVKNLYILVHNFSYVSQGFG